MERTICSRLWADISQMRSEMAWGDMFTMTKLSPIHFHQFISWICQEQIYVNYRNITSSKSNIRNKHDCFTEISISVLVHWKGKNYLHISSIYIWMSMYSASLGSETSRSYSIKLTCWLIGVSLDVIFS